MRIERIGDARLYLGNCLDALDDLQADSIIMDPPYGIDYASGHATPELWRAGPAIAGDRCTTLRDVIVEWAGERPVLCFGSWRAPRPEGTRQVLIWDKGGALGMGALDIPWKPDHEEIYVLGKGFTGSRDSGSVLRHPPVQSMAKNGRVHPTEKPVGLLQRLVAKVPGAVCDPFMGSGSTGVACAMLARPFVGVEIESAYFDIACERIENAYRQQRMFT